MTTITGHVHNPESNGRSIALKQISLGNIIWLESIRVRIYCFALFGALTPDTTGRYR